MYRSIIVRKSKYLSVIAALLILKETFVNGFLLHAYIKLYIDVYNYYFLFAPSHFFLFSRFIFWIPFTSTKQ